MQRLPLNSFSTLIMTVLLLTRPLHAAPPYPPALLFPHPELNASALIQNPKPLALGELPLNLQHALKGVQVGKPFAGSGPLLFTPLLCRIAQEPYIFVLAQAPQTQTLRAVSFAPGRSLTPALLRSLQADLAETTDIEKQGLQISLHPQELGTRTDQATPLCLSLVLARSLIQQGFAVKLPLAKELERSLQAAFEPLSVSPRANRALILHFGYGSKRQAPLRLPFTFDFSFTPVEAVFAKRVAAEQSMSLRLERNPLRFIPPPALLKFLSEEARALESSEAPKVVKVYGAWAYLDKGRAYGLRLRERLLIKGKDSFGHVIGYYGPELGLRSQRGFSVHEGAIVYIRKGQALVRTGDELTFDPARYPQ